VIEPYYYDYWGKRVETPAATQRALHDAIGGETDGEAEALAPTIVVRRGERLKLPDAIEGYAIELENGEPFSGTFTSIPLGYHRLTPRRSNRSCTLIVVPTRCYLPPAMRSGRIWALSTQLYALRSARNWGIGDFTDLSVFARLTGAAGAHAVGLNPLHELHPSNPQAASPYSPSSRLFLNALYIDVESVPELAESPDTQAMVGGTFFARRLDKVRRAELVDYAAVAALKFEILGRLHRALRAPHSGAGNRRAREFERFVRAAGVPLQRLSIYEALCEHFRARDPACYGWQLWPHAYRSPESPEVARFAAEHAERVEFYAYVQWLAHQQFAAAGRDARNAGVALYCDLAVGAEINGADAWADQDAIIVDASLGAPPDPLNTQGQNWGVAPFSPRALRRRAYQPFIAMLRANMRRAGILRIDHVMALRRAFWIPRGAPAAEGTYVVYPLEEMLGIVALESRRNRCAVVGEDLGTVPEGFRETMHAAQALSSRVFYFERDWNAAFLAPENYPRLAATSLGTHDLPTLAGWWTGDRSANEDRARDRLLLVDALERAGALDAKGAAELREDAARGGTLAVAGILAAGMARFLAATPSMLTVVAIEDVLNETGAVNVPGTIEEHPNWRRKRSLTLDGIEADERLLATGQIFMNR
jgi:4-alpha-glucanotransferase